MSKVTYLTKAGLQELQDEIDQLIKVERPKITQEIADARDKGDLSENAEYHAAKEAQGMLEMKIAELNAVLRGARVLDASKIDTSKVQLMNKVKLKNLKTSTIMEYTIVPEREADIKKHKISIGTPIAKGLLGKKKGEIVEISVPAGNIEFEIMDISF